MVHTGAHCGRTGLDQVAVAARGHFPKVTHRVSSADGFGGAFGERAHREGHCASQTGQGLSAMLGRLGFDTLGSGVGGGRPGTAAAAGIGPETLHLPLLSELCRRKTPDPPRYARTCTHRNRLTHPQANIQSDTDACTYAQAHTHTYIHHHQQPHHTQP
jgi:hypothetical protein